MQHLTLPARPSSAQTARRFVASYCEQQRLAAQITDDALLVVSELVGNAVLHARSEARIQVELSGSVLRVEVADDSERMPQMQTASHDTVSGRGVRILDGLASRWGATRRVDPPPGKVVWVELVTA